MATFFSHSRGAVKRVNGPHAASPFFIAIAGQRRPFTAAIITQLAIQQQGNCQFLHTLDDTIFIYVFGNRIGETRISGISFADDCKGKSGVDQVLDTYENKKVSSNGTPVLIGIGPSRRFNAFLTGMQFDVTDSETQLGQWSFRFNTIPKR